MASDFLYWSCSFHTRTDLDERSNADARHLNFTGAITGSKPLPLRCFLCEKEKGDGYYVDLPALERWLERTS